MRYRPVGAIVLRQIYLMRSSPTRVLPLIGWVAVDIVLWGFLSRYLNSVTPGGGVNFIASLLGAVLLWDLFSRIMQGVTMGFLEDVWSRNFLNIFASPIRISEYLTGLVLTSMMTSTVSLVVMLMVATLVFGLPLLSLGLVLIAFLLVLFVFGIAFGIAACAMVLRFGPASEWLVWPIPAMLSPFVGVFYPLATLPPWMQAVARALPASYVFENMRSVLAGHGYSAPALWGGALLAIAYVAGAAGLFIRVYRSTMRSGLLARYSAESVS